MPERDYTRRIYDWRTGRWIDDYDFSLPQVDLSAPVSVTYNPQYNGQFGNSIMGQYYRGQEAQDRLGFKYRYGTIGDNEYNQGIGDYGSVKSSALNQAGLTAFGAGVGIATNMRAANQFTDTDTVNNQIRSAWRRGTERALDFSQIQGDYDAVNQVNLQSQRDIANRTGAQRAGAILSSGLQGFQAGNLIGGPVGGAIGAVVGAGLQGIAEQNQWNEAGRRAAEQRTLLSNARTEQHINSSAGAEDLLNYNHNQKVGRALSDGGNIKRSLNGKEFADMIYGRSGQRSMTGSAGLRKEFCKGGLKVSIKVK